MTASEVRDRLDHRFRLLVGHGAAWNATKRCATRWRGPTTCSMTRKRALLDRCSVFAGGFDLQSACAVAGSDDLDDYAMLDLLDALGAQVAAGRGPVLGADPVFDAGDDPPVRRGTTRRPWRRDRGPHRACPLLRRTRSRHPRAVGQPPSARGLRLVHASNWRICAPRSGGPPTTATSTLQPHRDICDVLGVWVENYEPVAWTEETHRARPRGRPSPARRPVCDGRAVLRDRTHRAMRSPLRDREQMSIAVVISTRAIRGPGGRSVLSTAWRAARSAGSSCVAGRLQRRRVTLTLTRGCLLSH